ncbi:resuscitation-promoting factor protein RpfB [Catenulispora yoronensis]|uniref:Resuscitation-promoting factor protein RpfB n=1 Tax=Catenulispora yoronensis TaxID=450799 RepID=A0ABN2UKW3_9ACTN
MSSRRSASRHSEGSKAKVRAVQGTVLLGLVGGVGAYVGFDKTVHITVDGQERTIHTFDGKVADVLKAQGITTGEHDSVAPAPGENLVDGETIAVNYGRQLDVTVDGADKKIWTTAGTVADAMGGMDLRGQNPYVSVNRDQPIGRQGLAFEVRTRRHVNILVDGKSVPVDTTAPTVAQALAEAGVTLAGQDTANPDPGTFPAEGLTITVERIVGTQDTKQEAIPFSTTEQSDPTAYVGSRKTVTQGVPGVQQVVYANLSINGVKQPPKVVSKTVTKQPVNAVVKVGTKPVPNSVAGADALNWAGLAKCESGGNPKSVGGGGLYFGLYQFSPSTWAAMGGSGLPSNATPEEQTYRAKLLYVRSGAGQWPVCGRNLFT